MTPDVGESVARKKRGVASRCRFYASRSETLRRLTASGDRLVLQVQSSAEETRSLNERNTNLIRRRADLVKASRPDLTELIDEYVARQERETRLL
ncbi:MAG: hypothetical protein WCC53_02815 [Thermoanaerobaculia bacterium]